MTYFGGGSLEGFGHFKISCVLLHLAGTTLAFLDSDIADFIMGIQLWGSFDMADLPILLAQAA